MKKRWQETFVTSNNLSIEEGKSDGSKSNTNENPGAARRLRAVSGNGSIHSKNQTVS
jgi:hypothetical protein